MKLRITSITFRMNDPQGSLKRVSSNIKSATTHVALLEGVLDDNKRELEQKGFAVSYVQSFECDVVL
jgi:hypothetical protein